MTDAELKEVDDMFTIIKFRIKDVIDAHGAVLTKEQQRALVVKLDDLKIRDLYT